MRTSPSCARHQRLAHRGVRGSAALRGQRGVRHDAPVRACRARSRLRSERQRGAAQSRLRLRHEGARQPGAPSGDPYFSHPLEVAAILTELKLDDATIATALLHDVIEDTDVTRAEIDQMFGEEIGALVEGLTKIKKLDLVTKKAEQAENFRKLLVAISSDIRVLLIKLADRLHNMRTLEHMKPESRAAHLRGDAGDLCAARRPHGHAGHARGARGAGLQVGLPGGLRSGDRQARRHRTSATRGWSRRSRPRSRPSSPGPGSKPRCRAARRSPSPSGARWRTGRSRWSSCPTSTASASSSAASTPATARSASSHATWRAVPGRFKDYISTPKQNNYQSIHTTIVGPRHQRVELQIRTAEMHQHRRVRRGRARALQGWRCQRRGARDGAAAKDNPYIWLRRLVDTLLEGDNPEEFLEHTKLELFQDQVFCFTPKGRLIALPRGATPIDFAYAVHTDIGNSCVGAVINGRQMPLDDPARNGDEVEVLTRQGTDAAGRLGAHRRHRQGALGDPPRRARGRCASSIPSSAGGCSISAFRRVGQEFTDEQAEEGAAPSDAEIGRGRVLPPSGAASCRSTTWSAPWCRMPSCVQGRSADAGAATRRSRSQSEDGWFNIAKGMGLKFRWPGSGGKDKLTPAAGAAHPRRAQRRARHLRGRRRGARRPHRRRADRGRRHPHLPDPLAAAQGIRARALDRRDLGHRPRQSRAVSRQDRPSLRSTSPARWPRSPS